MRYVGANRFRWRVRADGSFLAISIENRGTRLNVGAIPPNARSLCGQEWAIKDGVSIGAGQQRI